MKKFKLTSRYRKSYNRDIIGQGAFGQVREYRLLPHFANDNRNLPEVIAVKTIQMHTEGSENVLNEVKCLENVGKHKHIVEFIGADVLEEKGKVLVGMEMCQCSLEKFVSTRKGLDEGQTLDFSTQLADGINFLHESKVIHRDLKCENVLMTKIEKSPVLKICDFGLSKVINIDTYTSITVRGTRCYMAPELHRESNRNQKNDEGSFDPHASLSRCKNAFYVDMFSFGVIMYHMITDKYPFKLDQLMSPSPARLENNFTSQRYLFRVIKSLLSWEYLERPTAQVVLSELKKMKAIDNEPQSEAEGKKMSFSDAEQEVKEARRSSILGSIKRRAASREKFLSQKAILDCLKLSDFYPNQITPDMVRKCPWIECELEQLTLHDAGWFLIQRIFFNNHDKVKAFLTKRKIIQNSDDDEVSSSDDSDNQGQAKAKGWRFSTKKPPNSNPRFLEMKVSPSDILVAILLCSSSFLQEILAKNLFLGNFGVPFFLPDKDTRQIKVFMASLHGIFLPGKESNSILTEKTSIVSLFQISPNSFRFDKVLNHLIAYFYPPETQKRVVLLHQNSSVSSYLVNHSVELVWFSSSSSDIKPVIFLICHGDQLPRISVLNAILRLSTFSVINLSHEAVTMIESHHPQRIKFWIDDQCNASLLAITDASLLGLTRRDYVKFLNKDVYKENLFHKNNITLVNDEQALANKIARVLQVEKPEIGLGQVAEEAFSENQNRGDIFLFLDYQQPEMEEAHEWADSIISNFLQTNLSFESSLTEVKKLSRKEHEETSRILGSYFESLAISFAKLVTKHRLSKDGYSSRLMLCSLEQKLKQFVNDINKPLKRKITAIWQNMRSAHLDSNGFIPNLRQMVKEYLDIELCMRYSAFDIPQLWRELERTYEIEYFGGHPDEDQKFGSILPSEVNFSILPEMAALQLQEGQPIPFEMSRSWAEQVFEHLLRLIGSSSRIFTISIVGSVNSGKTCLLNQLFGAQFPTFSHPNTHGILGQLISVKEYLRKTCDYILLIDTEGLKTDAFGNPSIRNNYEIIYQIIPISDLIIINGYGHTDMLQTFKMIWEVAIQSEEEENSYPNLFITFQNEFESADGQKSRIIEEVRRSIQLSNNNYSPQKLDAFLDLSNDIYLINPMTLEDKNDPCPSKEYTHSIEEIRMNVEQIIENRDTKCAELDEVMEKICQLKNYNDIERCFFNLKSSSETMALSKLECHANGLRMELFGTVLKQIFVSLNQIGSKNSEEENEALRDDLLSELGDGLQGLSEKLELNLFAHFKQSIDKDMIDIWRDQWMQLWEQDFAHTSGILEKIIIENIDRRGHKIQRNTELEAFKLETIKKLKVEAKLLCTKFVSDAELEEKFESMWDGALEEIHNNNSHEDNIGSKVQDVLRSCIGPRDYHCMMDVKSEIESRWPSLSQRPFEEMAFGLIERKDLKILKKSRASKRDIFLQIAKFINRVFKDFNETIHSSFKNKDFHSDQPRQIFEILNEKLRNLDAKVKNRISFSKAFKLKIYCLVSKYLEQTLTTFQANFLAPLEPKKLFSQFKPEIKSLFLGTVENLSKEKMASKIFIEALKPGLQDSIARLMPQLLLTALFHQIPTLQSKQAFHNHILKELAHAGEVMGYIRYFRNASLFFSNKLEDLVNSKLFEHSFENDPLHVTIEMEQIDLAIDRIRKTLKKSASESRSAKSFFNKFYDEIKDTIPIEKSSLDLVKKEMVGGNLKIFRRNLVVLLQEAKKELREEAAAKSERSLLQEDHKFGLMDILAKLCIGCTHQCPFCRNVCIQSGELHSSEHSLIEHSFRGFGRYKSAASGKLSIGNCSEGMYKESILFQAEGTMNKVVPIEKYKTVFKNWSIPKSESSEVPLYWKFVMAQHSADLAMAFKAEAPEISEEWKAITLHDACESLN